MAKITAFKVQGQLHLGKLTFGAIIPAIALSNNPDNRIFLLPIYTQSHTNKNVRNFAHKYL
jgi:hypothetical protein